MLARYMPLQAPQTRPCVTDPLTGRRHMPHIRLTCDVSLVAYTSYASLLQAHSLQHAATRTIVAELIS